MVAKLHLGLLQSYRRPCRPFSPALPSINKKSLTLKKPGLLLEAFLG